MLLISLFNFVAFICWLRWLFVGAGGFNLFEVDHESLVGIDTLQFKCFGLVVGEIKPLLIEYR